MKIHDVEQRSPEWYALRLGIPTASEFNNLLTPTGKPSASIKTYARSLAVEVFTGTPDEGFTSYWAERGKELEDDALRAYQFATDREVHRVGFVTDDDVTRGCSPDGLVDDGMIEIKCLKRDNHAAEIFKWMETKEAPPEFRNQVQGQMMISERAWCDHVFYHPEMPLLIIRSLPNADIQTALASQIDAVLEERNRLLTLLEQFTESGS